jgi:hypothetical protein
VPRGLGHWSPNARRLLIDAPDGQHLVDVGAGQVTAVHGARAVLDDGGLIVVSGVQRRTATLDIVEPTHRYP